MPRPPDTTTFASPRSGRALFCAACSATSSAPSASTAPTATFSTAPAAPPPVDGGELRLADAGDDDVAGDLDVVDGVARVGSGA